jgi:hypothetical protein
MALNPKSSGAELVHYTFLKCHRKNEKIPGAELILMPRRNSPEPK